MEEFDKETLNRAKKYLADDYQRMQQKAALYKVLPAAVSFDGDGIRSGTIDNTMDRRFAEYVEAKRYVEAVEAVFSVMTNDAGRHRDILIYFYENHLEDWQIMQRINQSRATYYRHKKRALYEFIDLFSGIKSFN
ncbi:hypothetical protein C6P08_06920 [Weissella confusa]|uniref:ArpU family phage packaging/lysis transcriptional regulator n=1 Tax=Weissella TaxID=46255 RepID=UPI0010B4B56D|nr:ArpU family phage packaging/lysis transcriptional regulator [Weissella confusa]MBJ7694296.1 DUF1492 domain-containing protein [Weissella confusa]QBZ04928.1 hypothetical protein C6P08_06920 [Weissella confusa]